MSATVGGAIIVVIIVVIAAGVYLATTPSKTTTSSSSSLLSTSSSTSATTESTTSTSTLTSSVTTSSSASSSGASASITIPAGVGTNTSLNFQPSSITVAPGTTVTWTNKDTSVHDVYFTSVPSGASISPNPSPNTNDWSGNTYSVTLTVPGTYTYECQYHSWMTGTIVVS